MVSVRTTIVPFEAARTVRAETTAQNGGNISSTNVQGALQDLDGAIQNAFGALTEITASGTIEVAASEAGVAINKTTGSATTVQLPAAAARNGLPCIVKDMKGDANTNNITVEPNGSDTIDGASADVINVNYGARTYRPVAGGWLRT